MATEEQKFRLGLFLVFSTVLLILILGIFLVPKLKERGNGYVINFKGTSVNGLSVGSAVKYQGVEVGRVRRIYVNPDDLTSILVTVEVDRKFPVKKDMTATMQYFGITGLKFIELAGGSSGSPNLVRGDEIQAGRGLGEKAEDIMTNIDSAVKNINDLLDIENQKRIALFLENTARSSEVLSTVLVEKKQNLENAIINLENSSLKFQEITEHLSKVAANLESITGLIETDTDKMVSNISKRFSDEEMGRLLTNLGNFVDTATGSLKKIETVVIHQQESLQVTFENIGLAIENFSKFSRELIEDPTLFLRARKEKKK